MHKLTTWLVALAALLFTSSSAAYERAISLAPHITELIYAIGAEDKLIATVDRSDFPPAALDLPRVGDGISFSAEQMLAFQPDVIFAWQPSPALHALESQLAHHAIPIHYINPQSLAEIGQVAQQLGEWLDSAEEGSTFHTEWERQVQQLKNQYQDTRNVTLFISLHSQPLYSLNDPIVNDVLQLCGARNWLPPQSPKAPIIHLERLFVTPADGLIYDIWDEGLEQTSELLKQVYGRNLALIAVNPDHFYRAGPRLLEAAKQFCQELARSK